nr:MAG TPA: hypothetical protein [Bacteriophage sp.]
MPIRPGRPELEHGIRWLCPGGRARLGGDAAGSPRGVALAIPGGSGVGELGGRH